MPDPTPASQTEQVVARSVPPISRLSYFDVLVGVLRGREPKLDELRTAIGRHVEDLSARGEARQTRDWRRPLAYRDTVVACTRELVRWGYVDPVSLGDDVAAFERARDSVIKLTPEGQRFAALKAAERREVIGQRLLGTYLLFGEFLHVVRRYDPHLPELPDSQVKACFLVPSEASQDEGAWNRVADLCAGFIQWSGGSSVRRGPQPDREAIALGVGAYLRRRFAKRPPKDAREITGAVNKALGAIFLTKLGFTGERNAYERCLRWARDLYLVNDGRHVFDVPGWIAWAAADIDEREGSWYFGRRGVTQYREAAKRALVDAYRRIAATRRTTAIEVPLVPIYEVRETAALQCRVCDDVVDRVLGDLAFRRDSVADVIVQLQIADARDFVPSAQPFVYENKRYFYVTMQP